MWCVGELMYKNRKNKVGGSKAGNYSTLKSSNVVGWWLQAPCVEAPGWKVFVAWWKVGVGWRQIALGGIVWFSIFVWVFRRRRRFHHVGDVNFELGDGMEAQFVGRVANSVSSTIGTCVRVRALHDECLVVILQLSHLLNFNSVLRAQSTSIRNVKISRLCDSSSTYANLKFFLPWTFSETTVFVFFTSPLKIVGCFPSSFDWSNVKSFVLKNSAFLSTFDFMMILRADVPHMNRSIRSWKEREREEKILSSEAGRKTANTCKRWINESQELVNFHLVCFTAYLHSNYWSVLVLYVGSKILRLLFHKSFAKILRTKILAFTF